jgi:hypothetical protein
LIPGPPAAEERIAFDEIGKEGVGEIPCPPRVSDELFHGRLVLGGCLAVHEHQATGACGVARNEEDGGSSRISDPADHRPFGSDRIEYGLHVIRPIFPNREVLA